VSPARILLLAPALVVAAVVAAGALATPTTTECKGVKNCIDVVGPWVAVPAHGQATYLLQCPKNRSREIGGVDALASSQDIHVTFDGLLGGPVSPGVTTAASAYFRAVSGHGLAGSFQPRIGCLPANGGGGRQTTSAREATPAGPALILNATTVLVAPGIVRLAHLQCPSGARFVSSWTATAFQTANPPDVGLTAAIHVQRTEAKGAASMRVTASEALPLNVHAQVQLGVICAA